MRRLKQPTWTTLTLELLKGRDDFMTTKQIAAAVGAKYDQAHAALYHLRMHRAVDCVIEPNGVAWWLATPTDDDRSFIRDERALEDRPRCRRCYKRKPKGD